MDVERLPSGKFTTNAMILRTADWPGIAGLEGNIANASDSPEAAITERIAGHHVSSVQICSAQSSALFKIQPHQSLVTRGGSFVCALIVLQMVWWFIMTGGICQKKV